MAAHNGSLLNFRPSRPMSPIPEFTDAFSEVMKSDGTSDTKVIKDDTETDGNTNESDNDKHSESVPHSSEDTPRSVTGNKVSEGIDPVQMANEMESSNSLENLQNDEKPSQAGGSPMEEHWLEVSISRQSFICD
jgi:hypothetical protein